MHVGRARNPIIGDAVANLLDYAGYDVERHYYVNDAGRQMAVFTWAYETFDEEDLEDDPERDRIEYDLVRYYRKGNAFLENGSEAEVEEAEAEIESIMQGLEAGNEETYERVSEVVDQVLSGMKGCLERLPATPLHSQAPSRRSRRPGRLKPTLGRSSTPVRRSASFRTRSRLPTT